MLERVIQALEGRPGVDDWLVRRVRAESTQYYLIGKVPENRRSARTEVLEIEVHHDHPSRQGAPSRGSASVMLLPDELDRAAERVDEAVFMAGLADNPPYGLPGPATYPQVLVADRLLLIEPERVAQDLADQLLSAVSHEPGITLASAEMLLDRHVVTLRNSRGISAEQEDTSLLVDLVLLARDTATGQETEAHFEVRRRALETLDLAAIVRQQAQYARDTLRAREPTTGRLATIVSGDALQSLLTGMFISPLVFRSAAQFKYQGLSPWEIGASIYGDAEVRGDPLTMYANAILPWGTRSAAFDGEGLPGRRLLVIEHGVLRQFWASQRYAEYLNVPPTGEFGNLELSPGSMAFADMWEQDGILCHVVAFSSMTPDPVTGNFVAEIRLGYERRGHELQPIKGGSLSGNLFADLAGARLSQETVFHGHYLGPEAIRFPALTVSGG
ncbi:MAG: metallopeptidase TldD-related protein [Anaerolineae bacterium]|nr:metallopeptidase TldD-related protein [Anaerolineae bacterium]